MLLGNALSYLGHMLSKELSDFTLCSQQEILASDPIDGYEVLSQNCPLGTWLPKFLLLVMAVFISSFIHFQKHVSSSLCLFPVSLLVLSVTHASSQQLSVAWLPGGHRSPKLFPEVFGQLHWDSQWCLCNSLSWQLCSLVLTKVHLEAPLPIALHLHWRETPLSHQLSLFS